MIKNCIIFGFIIFFLYSFCFAQNKTTDSLLKIIHFTKDPDLKFQTILQLNNQFINPDSLLLYVIAAEQIAAFSKNKYKKSEASFLRAGYYARKNLVDSGLLIMDQLLAQYKNGQDKAHYLKYLFFRAKILDRGNRYSQALVQLYEVAETAAALKDTLTLIQAKTGIGWVLIEMEQNREALKWLLEAKNTSANPIYYKNYGALWSNLAMAYNGITNKDSSLYYIQKAIDDARENNNLLFLATALSMQAKIFMDNGMTSLAEAPLRQVIEIRKQLNDPFYVVFDMSSLASYYAKNGQAQKGIELCRQGIAIARQLQLPSQLMMIYKSLAENYKAAGNEKAYGETLEDIIALKDSFNSINSAKLLAELHEANETKKKETTINEQKLHLTRKNYLLFGSAIFVIMAIIIALLGFKNYRRKHRLRMELAIEKEKLVAAQAVEEAAEHERKRIAADLHDNLGAQANAILYSTELLQQENDQKEKLVNGLYHTAKDMLSSLRETLWALKKTNAGAEDIWMRIINFTNQISNHYPEVTIHATGVTPGDVQINSAKALNIVFIIQEAINNSLRHSSASNIQVISEYDAAQWKICVSDNGKGFDTENPYETKEHYGLVNMQERAAASSLELQFNSGAGKGTTVQLLTPVKNLSKRSIGG